MQSVTQKLFKISLAMCLSCQARVAIGQDQRMPERVLHLPTSVEAFDMCDFMRKSAGEYAAAVRTREYE